MTCGGDGNLVGVLSVNTLRRGIRGFFILAALWPTAASAVQQHGGAEGLVAHQIGHTFFVGCVGYLLLRVIRTGMKSSGWREFKTFLWLILAWNILTFSGHWMREYVDPAKYTRLNSHVVSYQVDGIVDGYFYLTRLDHLLLVPAFVFLLLSLRKWRQQA